MIAATFLYQPLFSLPLHIYSLIYTLKIYNSPRTIIRFKNIFVRKLCLGFNNKKMSRQNSFATQNKIV